MAMEKQPPQQQALKCPRCDSSNTKFCYYNNYSLSQPRHFCKACKRYWTRGGTLRNVPVGGGCRKNKRVKKPPSSSAATAIDSSPSSSSAPLVTANHPSSHSQMDHINPLFYGLHSSLSFPRFSNNSRAHDTSAPVYEYDLDQPQVNGLEFSSSGLMASTQDVTSKSALLLNHPLAPIFGSLNSTTVSASDSPNMASLMASNLQQHQKFIPGGGSRGANNFHGFSHYGIDHMQMQGNNQMEQIGAISPDPNSLFWNATSVGANWLDPPNIGSSVPSLI